MIKILDTTLREGEQSPGVFFSVGNKIELAKKLDEFGIDIIEVGAPSVSEKVAQAAIEISALKLKAETIAHSRPIFAEIDLVERCKTDQIGLFLATSNIHLENRLHMTKKQAINIVTKGVAYAKSKKLKVRYTPEDSTRTDLDFLLEICRQAKKSGADRIGLADTLGIQLPENFGTLVRTVIKEIDLPVEVHCHNDFGLALANSLAGVENGASYVSVSINGIGERCGITDLAEFVMSRTVLYQEKNNYNLEKLRVLSAFVEKISKIKMAFNKPVTGKNAFFHKAGLHTDAVIKDPHTFEAYDPSLLGIKRTIIIDRYAGKKAVVEKLSELNRHPTQEELEKILVEIKKAGDKNEKITDSLLIKVFEKIRKG